MSARKNGRKPDLGELDLRGRDALLAHVEGLARTMLDRGELRGSIAQAELSMVRPEYEAHSRSSR
jgi:hypothetical protein